MSYQNDSSAAPFTREEYLLFEKRFQEGYNIPDPRFCLWLQHQKHTNSVYNSSHSDEAPVSRSPSYATSSHCGSSDDDYPAPSSKHAASPLWTKFLVVPSPPYKSNPKAQGKARVLTSTSFLEELEAKEQKKKEAAEVKEKRRKEREERKAENLKLKLQKQRDKMAKQVARRTACVKKINSKYFCINHSSI